jgi:hypothetical protein
LPDSENRSAWFSPPTTFSVAREELVGGVFDVRLLRSAVQAELVASAKLPKLSLQLFPAPQERLKNSVAASIEQRVCALH